ncbi:MAG: DnaJ domain-containing protein [Treponema sp.]|nr:DnaJ domain-containing protein [Treponema sp.]
MGIFGEILGAAAGAAIDGIVKGINNSITESNLEDTSYVGILFDNNNIPLFYDSEIRNNVLSLTLVKIGFIIGAEVSKDNCGTIWDYYADVDENGDEIWEAFVLRGSGCSVKFGLYGMAQCAITIEGDNCGYCAKQIKQVLEQNQFDNIRFCFDEIPFHEEAWLRYALEELAISSSEKKKKKKDAVKITSGDTTVGSVLLKKMDEICKRRLDDIFNPDTLHFENQNDEHYLIVSDGNISIEFRFVFTEEPEEEHVYLEYSKGEKSISLLFDHYPGLFVDFELVSGDTIFGVSIEDEEINFESALKLIKTKKVEVPENFYDTVMDFIKALYTLAVACKSKMYQMNNNAQVINEALAQALEILELSEETCSVEEIKKAYRNLSKEYHPDMMQGLTEKMKKIAEEKMQELRDAYEFLIEYCKRG